MTNKILVGGVASIVFVTALLLLGAKSEEQTTPTRADTGSDGYWEESIKVLGGDRAYEEFAHAVSDFNQGRQHAHAHTFGAALYEVEGLEGLPVCDGRFSYGCFHEFLGHAIAEHGIDSVSLLNDGCIQALVESPLSCQHGIGHGVMAFFGYSEGDLLHALDVCLNLPYNDPIGGCYGGVFMEYNLHTMLGFDANLREFQDNIGEPCDSLSSPYKAPCVYWQPQWWHQAIFSGESTAESYSQMGEYCREVGDTSYLIRSCMEGLGTITAYASRYDPDTIMELCDAAASNISERLYCTSLAANSMGIEVDKLSAERACASFSGDHKEYCLAYARNEANILNVRAEP
ncbi:hypothetical protein COU18_02425 [Candidatus Kaiserbacteria bacterium CG10_big_fil_rev_8_21_14_0_10_51_14]|uniref:Uncharacterized protein n=1 Tax=Candidatus Kaiserbacteria bacterium CG10_big_fil_rev_8_21_14_0_10_51_14 TaxID=1974610 RepID=A0A2H0UBM3_9BACT|nr:MAG: hypothetical protein COU18_02425 [Candidatus Kaiserbacteria bacterium CG10_big_fil_rev_8_21_14_0_10_51_14]